MYFRNWFYFLIILKNTFLCLWKTNKVLVICTCTQLNWLSEFFSFAPSPQVVSSLMNASSGAKWQLRVRPFIEFSVVLYFTYVANIQISDCTTFKRSVLCCNLDWTELLSKNIYIKCSNGRNFTCSLHNRGDGWTRGRDSGAILMGFKWKYVCVFLCIICVMQG